MIQVTETIAIPDDELEWSTRGPAAPAGRT